MNLLFDYDGTIHDCIKIYEPAFRIAEKYLQDKAGSYHADISDFTAKNPLPTASTLQLKQWLGDTPIHMWNEYAPALPQKEKETCIEIIKTEMIRLTLQGCARLYPHTADILKELRNRSYHLILLSNCQWEYMDAHIQAFHLNKLFDDIYCSADYQYAPKSVIFHTILKEHPGNFTIIGDRHHDIDIAREFHYSSIGCCYGYGLPQELTDATYQIQNISELLDIL